MEGETKMTLILGTAALLAGLVGYELFFGLRLRYRDTRPTRLARFDNGSLAPATF